VTTNLSRQLSEINSNSAPISLELFPRNGRGKIKELRIDWGFIEGEDGKDYFLYCKSMSKESVSFRHLKIGDLIAFHCTYPVKGPRAENALKIEVSKV
jgi:cold shock CspA family protein